MGVYSQCERQLASVDNDVPHAGLPDLRTERRRTSYDECAAARSDGDSPVFGSAADDRRLLAQRLCGGGVCHPSVAGGIGGVGVGAQRRVERVVFHADGRGVCSPCAPPVFSRPLSAGGFSVHAGFDVQANAGHAAAGVAAIGLLAAGPFRKIRERAKMFFYSTAAPA